MKAYWYWLFVLCFPGSVSQRCFSFTPLQHHDPGPREVQEVHDWSQHPYVDIPASVDLSQNWVVVSNIFFSIPIWGRFPFWRSYFSDGLKPPTREFRFRRFCTQIRPWLGMSRGNWTCRLVYKPTDTGCVMSRDVLCHVMSGWPNWLQQGMHMGSTGMAASKFGRTRKQLCLTLVACGLCLQDFSIKSMLPVLDRKWRCVSQGFVSRCSIVVWFVCVRFVWQRQCHEVNGDFYWWDSISFFFVVCTRVSMEVSS